METVKQHSYRSITRAAITQRKYKPGVLGAIKIPHRHHGIPSRSPPPPRLGHTLRASSYLVPHRLSFCDERRRVLFSSSSPQVQVIYSALARPRNKSSCLLPRPYSLPTQGSQELLTSSTFLSATLCLSVLSSPSGTLHHHIVLISSVLPACLSDVNCVMKAGGGVCISAAPANSFLSVSPYWNVTSVVCSCPPCFF